MEYYFSELDEKLKDALIKIKNEGVGSMEAEDIMQIIIREDFRLTGLAVMYNHSFYLSSSPVTSSRH